MNDWEDFKSEKQEADYNKIQELHGEMEIARQNAQISGDNKDYEKASKSFSIYQYHLKQYAENYMM